MSLFTLGSLDKAMQNAATRKPLKVRKVAPLYDAPKAEALEAERTAYAAWNEKNPVPGEHERHKHLDTARLWSTCQPCAERRIRYLANQPEYTHAGRNGRRLAELYGVGL